MRKEHSIIIGFGFVAFLVIGSALVLFDSNAFDSDSEPIAMARPRPAAKPNLAVITDDEALEKIADLEELKDPGAGDFRKMRELYVMLSQSNKNVTFYRQKVTELDAQIVVSEAKEAEEEAIYTAEVEARKSRERNIKGQFSAWDGSHYLLTRMIKARMKNPDSFQHVETRSAFYTDYVYVETTYRGTNSFGAVVPATISARFTIEGEFVGYGSAGK